MQQVACLSSRLIRSKSTRGLYLEYPSWANTTHMFPPRFSEHQYQLVFYHGGVYLAVLNGHFIFCRREGRGVQIFWGFPLPGWEAGLEASVYRRLWRRSIDQQQWQQEPKVSTAPSKLPPPVSCGWWGGSKQAASWRSLVFPPVGPKSPPPSVLKIQTMLPSKTCSDFNLLYLGSRM